MAGERTFREHLAQLHYSPRSVTLYDQYARRADAALPHGLRHATEDELLAWWSTLPPSSSSRNGARHALIAWYRWHGQRDGGPARFVERIPAPHGLPRPIPEHEYLALMSTAERMGGIWAVLVALLGYTGCRIGEATRARWPQIDLRDDVWRIEGKGSRRRGPKLRVVPLHPRLAARLRLWRVETDSADWLFPSPLSTAGHLHVSTLQKRLAEVAEAAGVERATAHRYRHSVGTLGVRRTGNLSAMRLLLGHASLATTQVYVDVDAEELRGLVGALG